MKENINKAIIMKFLNKVVNVNVTENQTFEYLTTFNI